MPLPIAETFELLFEKNNRIAYQALQELQNESEKNNCLLFIIKLQKFCVELLFVFFIIFVFLSMLFEYLYELVVACCRHK